MGKRIKTARKSLAVVPTDSKRKRKGLGGLTEEDETDDDFAEVKPTRKKSSVSGMIEAFVWLLNGCKILW
jgi:hypothetical protein